LVVPSALPAALQPDGALRSKRLILNLQKEGIS
jgi:hypothetical protein